ncbi:MAG: trypsin-like peptidase domain-containing protein [Vicinamibacterales bacterium]
MRSAERARAGALAIAALLAAATASAQPAGRRAAAGDDLSAVLEATTRAVGPAVVEIHTTAFVPADGRAGHGSDLVTTARGAGSGVVVDADGYIVTNAHVVRGAQRLRVDLPVPARGRSILAARTRSLPAEVVGIDLETDLAVIKVAASGLPVVRMGDSDELRAGQLVLAFGSPLGLQNSVSLGVVSAVARQLEPDAPMIYIQTDAPINAGSSGGPLVDLEGRLVGLNTLMLSRTGGYEGLGFAAPSNIVRTVYEHLRAHGRVRRGDIGVRAQTITPALAEGLGLAGDAGVVLADVLPRTSADVAGLRPGDLVLALDGKPMENSRQLQVGLYRRFVGDVVTLALLRDGQPVSVPVAVAERPDPLAPVSASADPRRNRVDMLGILAVALDPAVARLLPAVRIGRGVVVVSSAGADLDAVDGPLLPGDVICAVNRTPVADLMDLRQALASLPPGRPFVLQIERQGERAFLTFGRD